MLTIQQQGLSFRRGAILLIIITLLVAVVYVGLLVVAPHYSNLFLKPIDTHALATPKSTYNRIIIPTIASDVSYATTLSAGEHVLWSHSERGNPEKGGNFILAAPYFTLQSTPQDTIKASPFYHLDKLIKGDQIIIDFDGVRYAYTVTKAQNDPQPRTTIEQQTESARLTLYTFNDSASTMTHTVVYADLAGKVSTDKPAYPRS